MSRVISFPQVGRYFSNGRSQMDSGTITVIVGGIVAIVTAVLTWLGQFWSSRRKIEADAQVTAVSGFISLVTHLQNQVTAQIARINDLETKDQKQDRRISQLERLLTRNNIELPQEDGKP